MAETRIWKYSFARSGHDMIQQDQITIQRRRPDNRMRIQKTVLIERPKPVLSSLINVREKRIREIEASTLEEYGFKPVEGDLSIWKGAIGGVPMTVTFPALFSRCPIPDPSRASSSRIPSRDRWQSALRRATHRRGLMGPHHIHRADLPQHREP